MDTEFQTKLFINNEYVSSKSGKTFPVVNPSTEEVLCHVEEANEEDVDLAVKAARAALNGKWGSYSGAQRGRLLYKLADLLERDREKFARLETTDNGKPVSLSDGDMQECLDVLRYFAGFADKFHGSTLDSSSNMRSYTMYEPYGVVGLITPWNYPLDMAVWKLSPALAAGNAVVLKPSEKTPLTCLEFGRLVKEAGFPPGVVNILAGGGSSGSALSAHKDVDRVAFTGSGPTGRKVLRAAADSNLKMTTLELGGKSPLIIFPDSDIEQAVEAANNAIFFNMGQVCCAGSRLFLHKDIYETFIQKLVERVKCEVVGDPYDFMTTFGPIVDDIQLKRVLGYLEKAKQENLTLVTGGKRMERKGYYVEPTIFRDVDDNSTLAKEEIFGPVLCVMKPFSSLDEVVQRANCTCYGLAAGVFSDSVHTVEQVVKRLKAGTVWINNYNTGYAHLPFGGFKESGFGRDLGEEAIYEFLICKSVIQKTFTHSSRL